MNRQHRRTSTRSSHVHTEALEDRQMMIVTSDGLPPDAITRPLPGFDPRPIHMAPAKASIAGQVYNDRNANGVRDRGERGLAGRVVFLDVDADGVHDADERSLLTGRSGNYAFKKLPAGTYAPQLETPPLSAERTTARPAAAASTVFGTQKIRHQDFAVTTTYPASAADAHLSGVVGRDSNLDGTIDPGEALARKVTLSPTSGEGPSYTFVTAGDGRYDLPAVRPGTYRVHDELVNGGGMTTLRLDTLSVAPGEQAVRNISAQSFEGFGRP